jgi:hypothetical protein
VADQTAGGSLIRRFLLGDATEEEREAVEARFFSDDDFFGELVAEEDDLIDEYVGDALPPASRQRFEARYLVTPRGRERVAFGRAVRRLAPLPAARGRTGLPSWLPMAAALVMGLSTALLAVRTIRLEGRLESQGAEQARSAARAEELQRELASARARAEELARRAASTAGATAGSTPSFTLAAGGTRDPGETPALVVTATADVIVLKASSEREWRYASYRAAVRTVEGAAVFQADGLPASADGSAVAVPVPSAVLPPGDYILTLSGRDPAGRGREIADYYFRVARR